MGRKVMWKEVEKRLLGKEVDEFSWNCIDQCIKRLYLHKKGLLEFLICMVGFMFY